MRKDPLNLKTKELTINMQECRNSMNSEVNTSQKSHIKYQFHRAKIGPGIAQENSQKASRTRKSNKN